MRKDKDLLQRIYRSAELDPAQIPGIPLVEVCGRKQVLVENHRGVRAYGSGKVLVNTKCGVLCICGSDLSLCVMSKERLVVRGKISAVQYQELSI